MTNKITIVEAIKQVLKTSTVGMTSQEIYNQIVQRKLYCFGAKTPEAVVHGKLRIHCKDLDFPTASPTKYFYLKKRVGRKNYYALLGSENQEDNNVLIENEIENEMLAEEKMYKAYIQYSKELENNILERILHCKPEFFERLVVDLLIKMGYGYDNKSGKVVGKSHDGGVDGIIQEDKLGLSNIYIQAKRYSGGNKVGSHEIQAFVGAMQKVQKGVFITTSDFTKEALKFSEDQQQKQLRLVSGHELARLIIQNEVGLEPIQKYAVYKIDDEYFDDEI